MFEFFDSVCQEIGFTVLELLVLGLAEYICDKCYGYYMKNSKETNFRS